MTEGGDGGVVGNFGRKILPSDRSAYAVDMHPNHRIDIGIEVGELRGLDKLGVCLCREPLCGGTFVVVGKRGDGCGGHKIADFGFDVGG